MSPRFFCGEALCKAPIAFAVGANEAWPIRCKTCGSALYPADVLTRLPASELEPKRAELMIERAGTRIPFLAADAAKPLLGPTPASNESDIDKLLASVELDPAGAELRRLRRRNAIVGVVLVIVIALAALLFLTRP